MNCNYVTALVQRDPVSPDTEKAKYARKKLPKHLAKFIDGIALKVSTGCNLPNRGLA